MYVCVCYLFILKTVKQMNREQCMCSTYTLEGATDEVGDGVSFFVT